MTITLNRAYQGFPAGQVVDLPADATLTSIVRVLCAAGVMTITGNATATASTRVSYFWTN